MTIRQDDSSVLRTLFNAFALVLALALFSSSLSAVPDEEEGSAHLQGRARDYTDEGVVASSYRGTSRREAPNLVYKKCIFCTVVGGVLVGWYYVSMCTSLLSREPPGTNTLGKGWCG